MATIHVGHGRFALVDDADLPLVSQHHWYTSTAGGNTYAYTRINRRRVGMHQLICPTPAGMQPDHWNRNTLDNRRENLRPATRSQNVANRRCGYGKSGYRGVAKRGTRWEAIVVKMGKPHRCGFYATAEDAARVADAKGVELFGEFYLPNFPYDPSRPLPPQAPPPPRGPTGPRRLPSFIGGVEHWRCSRCDGVKPRDKFGPNHRRTGAVPSWCKRCIADDMTSRRYRRLGRPPLAGPTVAVA